MRANEVERTPAMNDNVLSRSLATWTQKNWHGTKIYEQWQGPKKEPKLTA